MVEVPPELTAELLADSRLPRHPAISPDGRWVAYVVVPVSVREHRVSSHELVIYPREGHSIVERSHQIDLLRRTRAWFGRWLGIA